MTRKSICLDKRNEMERIDLIELADIKHCAIQDTFEINVKSYGDRIANSYITLHRTTLIGDPSGYWANSKIVDFKIKDIKVETSFWELPKSETVIITKTENTDERIDTVSKIKVEIKGSYIYIYDKDFYKKAKVFAEKYGYESIVKCWNGLIEQESGLEKSTDS